MNRLIASSTLALMSGLSACGGSSTDAASNPSPLTRKELLDPRACQSCHPAHYDEWAGSMHAYASRDPVFRAMNARGQEETNGELGTFCIDCHAPMAVRDELTDDGLDLAEVPDAYQGVTCYFCHNVDRIDGVHNNPLGLANDTTMRGPFGDATANTAHSSVYSPHFDSTRPESSALCGTCHDVTLTEELVGHEIRLERTYREWQESLFAKPHAEGGIGCNGCHMPESRTRDRAATTASAPSRRSRRHDFEGVDLALEEFPNRERQRLLVERLLGSSLLAEICVSETGAIQVTLENAGAGHHWPSGASHDREAWLEVRAFVEAGSEPIFRTVSPEMAEDGAPSVVLKDHVVDAAGEPAHMFWDVAEVRSSTTLPGAVTRDPLDPEFHRERRVWTFNTERAAVQPLTRVDLTVKLRPIGLSILRDLVSTGHLEQRLVDAMPVLEVLPNRCYDPAMRERHADILTSARATCDEEQHGEFTLVWLATEANSQSRSFRITTVDAAPARCLAHPSYVAVPPPP